MTKFSNKNQNPHIRNFYDMKSVLYDQRWLKNAPDFEVYRFWRGEAPEEQWQDKEIPGLPGSTTKFVVLPGLRYDITIIHPKMMGKEFPKTMGHCHKNNIPELIKVLEGQAFYLFQKGNEKEIEDVYVVKAGAGDYVLIPAEPYNHLTINPSSENRLVMANWINPECQNDYSLFEKTRGACYYYTTEGWIKNPNYAKIPELRFVEALKKIPENFKGPRTT